MGPGPRCTSRSRSRPLWPNTRSPLLDPRFPAELALPPLDLSRLLINLALCFAKTIKINQDSSIGGRMHHPALGASLRWTLDAEEGTPHP